MFCPQCSQQQLSDEVRFCSRCGFPLGGVARLLTSGGELTEVGAAEGRRQLTARQRGMREAFVAVIAGILFAGLALLLTAFKEDLFVLMPVAALVFFGGLVRLLYVALLEEDTPRDGAKKPAATSRERTTAALGGAGSRGAELPPARGFAAADFVAARADTSEMAAPASVTENTTRLLEDEQGK